MNRSRMKPKILNYGSLNIDHVYQVPHFVQPGETLTSASLHMFAGGKGANQSVALARAGATVFHAGKIGKDGLWLKEKLEQNGVNTQFIEEGNFNNGHAMIQVDPQGENAIILYGGANQEIEKEEVLCTLSKFEAGDFLLLQNEINLIPFLIEQGAKQQLEVCFNPAPLTPELLDYPLELVKLLIVNEIEGAALTGKKNEEEILEHLCTRFPKSEILLTVGAGGSYFASQNETIHVSAHPTDVVDTTAAGDTFIGYFLAARMQNKSVQEALNDATQAAAICVSKEGAMDSIPSRFYEEKK